jgi:hypothetical protein
MTIKYVLEPALICFLEQYINNIFIVIIFGKAWRFAFRAEKPGLPRRYAPRNDGKEVKPSVNKIDNLYSKDGVILSNK